MNSIDFSRRTEYIEKLKQQEFFSFHDREYHTYGGDISERVYVAQDVKGIYSGVAETKNQYASKSVITFFEFNYVDGNYSLWNGKGKRLQNTTQNLNRVFRNADAIDNLNNDNFTYLKNMGRAYSWDVTTGILTSLEVGGELAYNMSLEFEDDDNSNLVFRLKDIAYRLYKKGMKPSYKNIIKFMGLTKADLNNDNYKNVNFGIINEYNPDWELPGRDVSVSSMDYSKGEITKLQSWYSTPRARLEMADIMEKLSSEYGYHESYTDIFKQIKSSAREIYNSMKLLEDSGRYVNLEKMIKYLYIDVFYHQGITTLSNTFSLYADYIRLVSDIDGFIMYPKYLRVAHDIASKAKSQIKAGDTGVYRTSKELRGMEGLYTLKVNGSKKLYPLEVLLTGDEIRSEATNQSNCLAGYISTVAKGRSIIMSLKNPDSYEEDKTLKSWISVEVRSSTDGWYLGQAYKTYNDGLSKEDMDVLGSILKHNHILLDHRVTGYGLIDEDGLTAQVVKKVDLEGSHAGVEDNIAKYELEVQQAKEELSHNTEYIGRL